MSKEDFAVEIDELEASDKTKQEQVVDPLKQLIGDRLFTDKTLLIKKFLQVEEGRRTYILRPFGFGKTTLLDIIEAMYTDMDRLKGTAVYEEGFDESLPVIRIDMSKLVATYPYPIKADLSSRIKSCLDDIKLKSSPKTKDNDDFGAALFAAFYDEIVVRNSHSSEIHSSKPTSKKAAKEAADAAAALDAAAAEDESFARILKLAKIKTSIADDDLPDPASAEAADAEAEASATASASASATASGRAKGKAGKKAKAKTSAAEESADDDLIASLEALSTKHAAKSKKSSRKNRAAKLKADAVDAASAAVSAADAGDEAVAGVAVSEVPAKRKGNEYIDTNAVDTGAFVEMDKAAKRSGSDTGVGAQSDVFALNDSVIENFSYIPSQTSERSSLFYVAHLLSRCAKQSRVLLIDNIDAPLLSAMTDPMLYNHRTHVLTYLFSVLGAHKDVFRHIIITGCMAPESRAAAVTENGYPYLEVDSRFSYSEECAKLMGISEDDLLSERFKEPMTRALVVAQHIHRQLKGVTPGSTITDKTNAANVVASNLNEFFATQECPGTVEELATTLASFYGNYSYNRIHRAIPPISVINFLRHPEYGFYPYRFAAAPLDMRLVFEASGQNLSDFLKNLSIVFKGEKRCMLESALLPASLRPSNVVDGIRRLQREYFRIHALIAEILKVKGENHTCDGLVKMRARIDDIKKSLKELKRKLPADKLVSKAIAAKILEDDKTVKSASGGVIFENASDAIELDSISATDENTSASNSNQAANTSDAKGAAGNATANGASAAASNGTAASAAGNGTAASAQDDAVGSGTDASVAKESDSVKSAYDLIEEFERSEAKEDTDKATSAVSDDTDVVAAGATGDDASAKGAEAKADADASGDKAKAAGDGEISGILTDEIEDAATDLIAVVKRGNNAHAGDENDRAMYRRLPVGVAVEHLMVAMGYLTTCRYDNYELYTTMPDYESFAALRKVVTDTLYSQGNHQQLPVVADVDALFGQNLKNFLKQLRNIVHSLTFNRSDVVNQQTVSACLNLYFSMYHLNAATVATGANSPFLAESVNNTAKKASERISKDEAEVQRKLFERLNEKAEAEIDDRLAAQVEVHRKRGEADPEYSPKFYACMQARLAYNTARFMADSVSERAADGEQDAIAKMPNYIKEAEVAEQVLAYLTNVAEDPEISVEQVLKKLHSDRDNNPEYESLYDDPIAVLTDYIKGEKTFDDDDTADNSATDGKSSQQDSYATADSDAKDKSKAKSAKVAAKAKGAADADAETSAEAGDSASASGAAASAEDDATAGLTDEEKKLLAKEQELDALAASFRDVDSLDLPVVNEPADPHVKRMKDSYGKATYSFGESKVEDSTSSSTDDEAIDLKSMIQTAFDKLKNATGTIVNADQEAAVTKFIEKIDSAIKTRQAQEARSDSTAVATDTVGSAKVDASADKADAKGVAGATEASATANAAAASANGAEADKTSEAERGKSKNLSNAQVSKGLYKLKGQTRKDEDVETIAAAKGKEDESSSASQRSASDAEQMEVLESIGDLIANGENIYRELTSLERTDKRIRETAVTPERLLEILNTQAQVLNDKYGKQIATHIQNDIDSDLLEAIHEEDYLAGQQPPPPNPIYGATASSASAAAATATTASASEAVAAVAVSDEGVDKPDGVGIGDSAESEAKSAAVQKAQNAASSKATAASAKSFTSTVQLSDDADDGDAEDEDKSGTAINDNSNLLVTRLRTIPQASADGKDLSYAAAAASAAGASTVLTKSSGENLLSDDNAEGVSALSTSLEESAERVAHNAIQEASTAVSKRLAKQANNVAVMKRVPADALIDEAIANVVEVVDDIVSEAKNEAGIAVGDINISGGNVTELERIASGKEAVEPPQENMTLAQRRKAELLKKREEELSRINSAEPIEANSAAATASAAAAAARATAGATNASAGAKAGSGAGRSIDVPAKPKNLQEAVQMLKTIAHSLSEQREKQPQDDAVGFENGQQHTTVSNGKVGSVAKGSEEYEQVVNDTAVALIKDYLAAEQSKQDTRDAGASQITESSDAVNDASNVLVLDEESRKSLLAPVTDNPISEDDEAINGYGNLMVCRVRVQRQVAMSASSEQAQMQVATENFKAELLSDIDFGSDSEDIDNDAATTDNAQGAANTAAAATGDAANVGAGAATSTAANAAAAADALASEGAATGTSASSSGDAVGANVGANGVAAVGGAGDNASCVGVAVNGMHNVAAVAYPTTGDVYKSEKRGEYYIGKAAISVRKCRNIGIKSEFEYQNLEGEVNKEQEQVKAVLARIASAKNDEDRLIEDFTPFLSLRRQAIMIRDNGQYDEEIKAYEYLRLKGLAEKTEQLSTAVFIETMIDFDCDESYIQAYTSFSPIEAEMDTFLARQETPAWCCRMDLYSIIEDQVDIIVNSATIKDKLFRLQTLADIAAHQNFMFLSGQIWNYQQSYKQIALSVLEAQKAVAAASVMGMSDEQTKAAAQLAALKAQGLRKDAKLNALSDATGQERSDRVSMETPINADKSGTESGHDDKSITNEATTTADLTNEKDMVAAMAQDDAIAKANENSAKAAMMADAAAIIGLRSNSRDHKKTESKVILNVHSFEANLIKIYDRPSFDNRFKNAFSDLLEIITSTSDTSVRDHFGHFDSSHQPLNPLSKKLIKSIALVWYTLKIVKGVGKQISTRQSIFLERMDEAFAISKEIAEFVEKHFGDTDSPKLYLGADPETTFQELSVADMAKAAADKAEAEKNAAIAKAGRDDSIGAAQSDEIAKAVAEVYELGKRLRDDFSVIDDLIPVHGEPEEVTAAKRAVLEASSRESDERKAAAIAAEDALPEDQKTAAQKRETKRRQKLREIRAKFKANLIEEITQMAMHEYMPQLKPDAELAYLRTLPLSVDKILNLRRFMMLARTYQNRELFDDAAKLLKDALERIDVEQPGVLQERINAVKINTLNFSSKPIEHADNSKQEALRNLGSQGLLGQLTVFSGPKSNDVHHSNFTVWNNDTAMILEIQMVRNLSEVQEALRKAMSLIMSVNNPLPEVLGRSSELVSNYKVRRIAVVALVSDSGIKLVQAMNLDGWELPTPISES